MKRILFIAAVIVTLIIILPVVIGAFLPEEHTVGRTREFAAAPEAVWQAITNPSDQTWRRGIKTVEIKDRTWTDINQAGLKTDYKIIADDAPRRTIRRRVLLTNDIREWEFKLEPSETGTSVTILQRTKVNNPFSRFTDRLWRGPGQIDRYFDDLQKHLSQ